MTPKPQPLRGRLRVPGDKSISHRALMLAAVADGSTTLSGLGDGLDVASTASCLERMGVIIERGESWRVTSEGLREPADVLDVGNSGTSLRCLAGLCSGVEGVFVVLTGDRSIRSRPMLRVVAPLREMGAHIHGARHADRAPLAITGARLTGITRELDVASAQIKTALLLAGLAAEGTTTVMSPGPSRDHTERMLSGLGAPVTAAPTMVSLDGGWRPQPFSMSIPGDLSSALFLLAAALLVPGSELSIEGLGLNPTRSAALDVLVAMGADISWTKETAELTEPVGTVTARYSPDLHGTDISDPAQIPLLIDEIPILSVVAAAAHGRTRIRNAGELRVKESDRIAALAEGLATLGVPVDTAPDGLDIEGGSPLTGGVVRSAGDHRIAMSFAVAGLLTKDKVRVEGWTCVDTSFPRFLDLLTRAQTRKVKT